MASAVMQAVVIDGKHRRRIIKVNDHGRVLAPEAPSDSEIQDFIELMKRLEASVTRFDDQLARTVAKLEARGLIHGKSH